MRVCNAKDPLQIVTLHIMVRSDYPLPAELQWRHISEPSAMHNICQNVTVGTGTKGHVSGYLVGVTGLWPAILADTGATVLVTMNALRALHHNRA